MRRKIIVTLKQRVLILQEVSVVHVMRDIQEMEWFVSPLVFCFYFIYFILKFSFFLKFFELYLNNPIYKDINECLLGTHNCDRNATCINTPESFNCICNEPFIGNGTFCELSLG